MGSRVNLGVQIRSGRLSWALPSGIDAFAIISAIAALALLPFVQTQEPRLPGLNTVCWTTLLITQLATAFLLYARFQEMRAPSHLLLAGAYLYSALMAGLALFVFPDVLGPGAGLIATSLQSPAWLFHFWMWGFAFIVLAAVIAEIRWPDRRIPKWMIEPVVSRITAAMLLWIFVACVAIFIVPDRLPPLIVGQRWSVANMVLTYGSVLVMGASIALIHGRLRERDGLFVWLGAALVVDVTASLLSGWAGERFTLGWAVGRLYWAIAAAVVFIYFLRQFRRQQIALAYARDELEETVAERTGELARSMALLRAVSEGTSDLLFAKDRECRILFANPAGARIMKTPPSELIGATGLEGKLDRVEVEAYLANDRRTMERGQAETFEEVLTSVDGRRTYLATKAPLRDDTGHVVGLIEVSRDITERKRAEEQTKTLLMEVSHRAKNVLAVVQGMARGSAREEDPAIFASLFAERLSALAASHDLLVSNAWGGVDLADLILVQLAHIGELVGSRITLGGEPLKVQPGAAQALGMAIHELSTNAVKYGALSNEHGRVMLQWRLHSAEDGVERLEMTWIERGGPRVIAPVREGYGHSVIVRMVEHALDGEVRLDYRPEGLEWRLDAPVRAVLDGF